MVTSIQLVLLSSGNALWNTYTSIGFLNYYCTDGNSLHVHLNLILFPTLQQDVKILLPLFKKKNQWTPFLFANLWEKMYIFQHVGLGWSHNFFFNLMLVLIPSFLPSTHACFHLSLLNGLVYNFRLWGADHASTQDRQTDRRQTTETAWNFSVLSILGSASEEKTQCTFASYFHTPSL